MIGDELPDLLLDPLVEVVKNELGAEAFAAVTAAVNRHDTLMRWVRDDLIRITANRVIGPSPAVSVFRFETGPSQYRVQVGDVVIEEAADENFPSAKLIATIALILQARGELK